MDHANALEDTPPVVRRTAAFRCVENCVIYVGASIPPTDEDWNAYLAFIASRQSRTHPSPRIAWDESGGPSPTNRRKLAEVTSGHLARVAMISNTRTVSVALNWQRDVPTYRDFPPSQLEEAAAFVGLSGGSGIRVLASLEGLRRLLLGAKPSSPNAR